MCDCWHMYFCDIQPIYGINLMYYSWYQECRLHFFWRWLWFQIKQLLIFLVLECLHLVFYSLKFRTHSFAMWERRQWILIMTPFEMICSIKKKNNSHQFKYLSVHWHRLYKCYKLNIIQVLWKSLRFKWTMKVYIPCVYFYNYHGKSMQSIWLDFLLY